MPQPQPSEYENFLKFDAETKPGTIKPQTFRKTSQRMTEQERPLQSQVGLPEPLPPHPSASPGAFNEPFLGLWLGCLRRTRGVMITLLLFKVQLKSGFS